MRTIEEIKAELATTNAKRTELQEKEKLLVEQIHALQYELGALVAPIKPGDLVEWCRGQRRGIVEKVSASGTEKWNGPVYWVSRQLKDGTLRPAERMWDQLTKVEAKAV